MNLLLLVLTTTLYTGKEAELLRERESRAKIKNHLSHCISATCLLYRRGRYMNWIFPACAMSASQQHSRTAVLFFFATTLELRTVLQGADTSSEGYFMICMFWSWRMNIRCYGIGVWQIISPIQHLGNVTGLPEPLHRQMYDGRRLFLVDFPWFLFQIRCTRGLLLECLIWKGTIWNDWLMASSYVQILGCLSLLWSISKVGMLFL